MSGDWVTTATESTIYATSTVQFHRTSEWWLGVDERGSYSACRVWLSCGHTVEARTRTSDEQLKVNLGRTIRRHRRSEAEP